MILFLSDNTLLEFVVGGSELMLLTQSSPSPIFLAATSIIPIPQTFTANASGLRRLPLQSGHGLADIYLSISCLVWSDSVFL